MGRLISQGWLYPAMEFVIHDLEGLHRHGLETCNAPVQVLRSLQHVWNRHRCDVHAEFAEDPDRAKHMEIAGKQYFFARHVLDDASRFNSVFACRGGMPFGHDGLRRDPLRDEEVRNPRAFTSADHDLLKTAFFPGEQSIPRTPVRREGNEAFVVGRCTKQDKNIALWLFN